MTGDELAGFKTTVLPETMAAVASPNVMAAGKFQGGMTIPTPNGTYVSSISRSEALTVG